MRIISLYSLILFILLNACSVNINSNSALNNYQIEGEGEILSKNIAIDMFRYLEVDIDASVEIVQSDSLNVYVEGYKNIIDLLDISVSNSHMTIKYKKQMVHSDHLKFVISVPSIQKITLNGAGKFVVNSWKNEDKLQFINNGSTEFYVANLNRIKHLQIEINGSGSFYAKENSQLINSVHCELNGAGDVNLEQFNISHSTIEINGSGNVELGEIELLHTKIVGSGNVTYMGLPKIHQEIVGSGSVHQK